jgi:hypothetical protein
MLRSTMNRGFSLTFENGLTISVQFGTNSRCERLDYYAPAGNDLRNAVTESPDAEIAIWDKENNWYEFGHGRLKGYCSADDVARWITKVREAETLNSIQP